MSADLSAFVGKTVSAAREDGCVLVFTFSDGSEAKFFQANTGSVGVQWDVLCADGRARFDCAGCVGRGSIAALECVIGGSVECPRCQSTWAAIDTPKGLDISRVEGAW